MKNKKLNFQKTKRKKENSENHKYVWTLRAKKLKFLRKEIEPIILEEKALGKTDRTRLGAYILQAEKLSRVLKTKKASGH